MPSVRRIKLSVEGGLIRASLSNGNFLLFNGSKVTETNMNRETQEYGETLLRVVEFWNNGLDTHERSVK